MEESERHSHPSDLLGTVVLGVNDGVVTTLVFVLSISSASNNVRTAIIAGLSEMLAGGVSMFLGGYTAARATQEAYRYQVEVERREIRDEPEEEREEVKKMYTEKGFRGVLLDDIVHHVTSEGERWLKVMVRDELGAPPEERSPSWQVGAAIGLAFMVGAFVPLLPFIFRLAAPQPMSIAASMIALVLTGVARARYSRRPWWASVGEMVAIGAAGSVAGILIGDGLGAAGVGR